MTYGQAIKEARERYAAAMNEAAADVIVIVQKYGKPRATVCKDIAGADGWNALDHRARALEKSAGRSADEIRRARESENARKARVHAKSVLKDPDEAAKVLSGLSPQALDNVYHEAKLIRAGEDRSPANHKAAEAAAHRFTEPIIKALDMSLMAIAIRTQIDAGEELRQAMDGDAITPAAFAKFERAHEATAEVMNEVRFKLPART